MVNIFDKIETKNLVLRTSQFKDCEIFTKWETDKSVSQFFTMNEDRDFEYISREFIKQDESDTDLQYTIFNNEDKPIGRVHINHLHRDTDSLNINRIYIGEVEERRKGYGEEILSALLEYAFKNLHLERVTLSYYEGNTAASNLYSKLGFTIEGQARNATKRDGQYFNLYSLSILRGEYLSKKV